MIFKLHKKGFDVKLISEIVDSTEEYVETVILEKGLEDIKNKGDEDKTR